MEGFEKYVSVKDLIDSNNDNDIDKFHDIIYDKFVVPNIVLPFMYVKNLPIDDIDNISEVSENNYTLEYNGDEYYVLDTLDKDELISKLKDDIANNIINLVSKEYGWFEFEVPYDILSELIPDNIAEQEFEKAYNKIGKYGDYEIYEKAK